MRPRRVGTSTRTGRTTVSSAWAPVLMKLSDARTICTTSDAYSASVASMSASKP